MKQLLKILIATVLMCSGLGAYAKTVAPSPTLPRGMDPVRDSMARAAFRLKMDEIRSTRPVVALVLMGGGAKGAAHIGVIRYLEELDIPVDMVLGTSMGGLVGGMYAVGYNSSQMDSIIRNIDWSIALSDKLPESYISYSERKYKEKVVVSLPFYYPKKDFIEQKSEALPLDHKHDDLHLGANTEEGGTSNMLNNILESLPAGIVDGHNVNNLLSSLTVGYQDSTQFWKLPVPFACVATEMVTGRPKVWLEGRLNTALRSTMSIPGLFNPVREEGMVLVDGGMRDNYPTALARELGADIIIGVNISSGYKDYSGLNNFGDLLSQFIDMFGRSTVEKNLKLADVTISPDMTGYGMMSFETASIDTLIRRGYAGALRQEESLRGVKARMKGQGMKLNAPPALNLAKKMIAVSEVGIEGVDDLTSRNLMEDIGLQPLQKIGKDDIEDVEAMMYGTGAFDYVSYELRGSQEPYELVFKCKKGPINHIGLGARFDSEEIVSAMVNLGLNVHSLQGVRADFNGKIGNNPSLDATVGYLSPGGLALNAALFWHFVDRNLFSFGASKFQLSYYNLREALYLSNLKWSRFDMKVGLANEFYNINSMMSDDVVGDYDIGNLRNDSFGPFVNLRCDTFDDGYFPTRGVNIGINYGWMLSTEGKLLEDSFHAAQFDVKGVIPISPVVSVLPSIDMRYVFGSKIPVAYTNMMGGSLEGRYLDQQMPFVGINYAVAMPNFLTVARSDVRFRLFKNNYLTAIANYAIGVNDIREIINMRDFSGTFGAGLQYAYDSIIGPVSLDVHWSDFNKAWGVYLSIGFDF